MSEDTAEGVKDRLARRFEGGDGEGKESDAAAERSDSADQGRQERSPQGPSGRNRSTPNERTSGDESSSKNGQDSKNVMKAKNVKKEWRALSVYLPDELESDLSRTYKRLDWELEADRGVSIKKTRHYYPLVVELGLEQLDEMDSSEIEDRISSF